MAHICPNCGKNNSSNAIQGLANMFAPGGYIRFICMDCGTAMDIPSQGHSQPTPQADVSSSTQGIDDTDDSDPNSNAEATSCLTCGCLFLLAFLIIPAIASVIRVQEPSDSTSQTRTTRSAEQPPPTRVLEERLVYPPVDGVSPVVPTPLRDDEEIRRQQERQKQLRLAREEAQQELEYVLDVFGGDWNASWGDEPMEKTVHIGEHNKKLHITMDGWRISEESFEDGRLFFRAQGIASGINTRYLFWVEAEEDEMSLDVFRVNDQKRFTGSLTPTTE